MSALHDLHHREITALLTVGMAQEGGVTLLTPHCDSAPKWLL